MADKQKTILIVDDVYEVREVTSGILRHNGYTVSTAVDGSDALESLTDKPVDLIIVDIHMPVMDGIELVKKLKVLHPSIKCILISGDIGKTNEEYNYLAVAKRMTGLKVSLKKPFKPDDLIKVVESVLI